VALKRGGLEDQMLIVDWKKADLDDIGFCPVCFQSTYKDVCTWCGYWWPYRYGYSTTSHPTPEEIKIAKRQA